MSLPLGAQHGYPYVSYMINNGHHEYQHDFDGEHPELETSGCQSSFRNQEFHTYARITYKQQILRVELDAENLGEWKTCFVAAVSSCSADGDSNDSYPPWCRG